jgi:secreted PhoX family phosphatase
MRTRLSRAISALLTASVSAPTLAGTISFTEVPVPRTDAEKRAILASPSATVDGVTVDIGYNTILRSGEKPSEDSTAFGTIVDTNGNPVMAEDGSTFVSNSNDFSSLLQGDDGSICMVSHFESRPGAMYLTNLVQDSATGTLTATRTNFIDFSSVNGGWVHCAGSVTPWQTHLGSEEYEPDAKQWRDNDISDYNAAMARYFNADPSQALTVMNPYDYGWPVEVTVDNCDSASVGKHYAMGRIAYELSYVMPDNKTVYSSDDGTNVGLFRFVSDEEGDLSAGNLYIAQWNQQVSAGAGAASVNWISLGHATNAQVSQWIREYTFADIFDEANPIMEGGEDTGRCPDSYTSINTTAGHECLILKDVNEDGKVDNTDRAIASRLETRRFGAMQGGTTEFRKMEGITYSPELKLLAVAMSEVDRGMLDFQRVGRESPYNAYDIGGSNHMQLEKGNYCGAVYALNVDGNYTATSMWPIISGVPMTVDYGAEVESPDFDGINKCDVNGIANPDNITWMPGYSTLIIGEDTGSGHQNDMIWAMTINAEATGELTPANISEDGYTLTRIQTTPYGSETTSPYFYPDINGYAYLKSVIQHPYGESDEDKLDDPTAARGYTGYIGPFPAMTQ